MAMPRTEIGCFFSWLNHWDPLGFLVYDLCTDVSSLSFLSFLSLSLSLFFFVFLVFFASSIQHDPILKTNHIHKIQSTHRAHTQTNTCTCVYIERWICTFIRKTTENPSFPSVIFPLFQPGSPGRPRAGAAKKGWPMCNCWILGKRKNVRKHGKDC